MQPTTNNRLKRPIISVRCVLGLKDLLKAAGLSALLLAFSPMASASLGPCSKLKNGDIVRIPVKGQPQPQSALVLDAGKGWVSLRVLGTSAAAGSQVTAACTKQTARTQTAPDQRGHAARQANAAEASAQRQQEASPQVSSPSSRRSGIKHFWRLSLNCSDCGIPGWGATCNDDSVRTITSPSEGQICGYDGNESKCSFDWTAMDAANWSCR